LTIWDVIRVSRRLWPMVLIGLALTGLVTVTVRNQPGAYSGHARVTILAPEPFRGNAVAKTSDSLVALAGVVAYLAMGAGGDARSVSDQVTLLDEGVRDGYSIQQPNAGGQWVFNFQDAVLDVQSAGPTLERSQQQMDAALDSIYNSLDKLQASVAPDQRVTVHLSQGDPAFTYDHGSTMRATLATVLLGLILTFATPMIAERIIRTSPAPRTKRAPQVRRATSGRPDTRALES
jgi:hypothetical protein